MELSAIWRIKKTCQQNLSTIENKWEEKCLLLLIKVQVFVGFWFLAIDELMTPEEKAKLFTAIGYSDSSHHPSLPKQVSNFLWGWFKRKKQKQTTKNQPNKKTSFWCMLALSSRMCCQCKSNLCWMYKEDFFKEIIQKTQRMANVFFGVVLPCAQP